MGRLAKAMALACAAVLTGFGGTETYDDLGGVTGTPGFWNLGLHAGVTVEVAEASVGILSIGDRCASSAPACDGLGDLIPYSRHSLPSAARPLDSRSPCGLVILFN